MRQLLLPAALGLACLGAAGFGAAKAAVVCTGPGIPAGCTVVRPGATPVAGPGGPVVNPTPGVGYGAPGVGVRPAAGPGVGPNAGGPVNRPGRR